MNKALNTSVTHPQNKALTQEYTIEDVCEFTGISDRAIAAMAVKQAFITSGRALAQEAFLAVTQMPEGITGQVMRDGKSVNAPLTKTEWLKSCEGEGSEGQFPTAEEVWADALKRTEKNLDSEKGGTVKALKDELAQLRAQLAALQANPI